MEKKTLHHALVLKTNKEVAENAFEFGAKFSYKIPTMDEFNEFLDKLSDSEVAQLLYDITVLIEVKSILEDVLNSLLVSRGYTSISYLDQEIKPETKKN